MREQGESMETNHHVQFIYFLVAICLCDSEREIIMVVWKRVKQSAPMSVMEKKKKLKTEYPEIYWDTLTVNSHAISGLEKQKD